MWDRYRAPTLAAWSYTPTSPSSLPNPTSTICAGTRAVPRAYERIGTRLVRVAGGSPCPVWHGPAPRPDRRPGPGPRPERQTHNQRRET
jgi:hypothetical protein